MTRPRASTGILLAVGAAVLFAVNGNVSKVALLNGISSLELVSVRSAGTALILLGITALRSPAALRVGRRELGFLALYGVTGIAMVQWLYFVALQRMPVGIALLFEYTAPLMVALWVRFVQKQPVKSRLWLGLAFALAGLAMVAQFWKGMTLDPVGLGQRGGSRRGVGLLLPDGRARPARTRPDLVDGLQLWLLRRPLGDRLALVDLPVLEAGRHRGSARRSPAVPSVADGPVDHRARHRRAVPAGPACRRAPGTSPGGPDRHARARRRRHHRLGPARGVPQHRPGRRVDHRPRGDRSGRDRTAEPHPLAPARPSPPSPPSPPSRGDEAGTRPGCGGIPAPGGHCA